MSRGCSISSDHLRAGMATLEIISFSFALSGVGALIFHDGSLHCLESVCCCFYASPYSRCALLHSPAFNLRYAAECQLIAHIPTRLACAFGLRVALLGDCRSMPHMHIAFPIAHCLYAQFSGVLFCFIALGRLFGGWLSHGLSFAFGWLLDARRRYFDSRLRRSLIRISGGCFRAVADCSMGGFFDGVLLADPRSPSHCPFARLLFRWW